LAGRLVDGLKDEYKRWKGNVEDLIELTRKTVGVNLISSGFVSYLGPYDLGFRNKIWSIDWMKKLSKTTIPYKDNIDPLTELVDNATIAEWSNQGLPDDRFSKENASIIEKCKRWPLIIDPQLQASKYLKSKFQEFVVTTFSDRQFELKVKNAIEQGKVLILENVQEELEPTLDPVLARAITKKGSNQFIKLGEDEVQYNPEFKLIMLSKLVNLHGKPEYAAQCTILNFIVTEDGLRDQLLGLVVREEKYELEEEKANLVKQQNEFIQKLNMFEKDLLLTLNNADLDKILDSDELVVKLEDTKENARLIAEAQIKAKETEKIIEESRKI